MQKKLLDARAPAFQAQRFPAIFELWLEREAKHKQPRNTIRNVQSYWPTSADETRTLFIHLI